MNSLTSPCCQASFIIISNKSERQLNSKKICAKCRNEFDKNYLHDIQSSLKRAKLMDDLSEKFQQYLNELWEFDNITSSFIKNIIISERLMFDLFLEFTHYNHEYFEKFTFKGLVQFQDHLHKIKNNED